jgi:glycolate oxidase iron-sulfur subunit
MSVYDPAPGQQVFGKTLPSYDELQGCIRCGRCLPVCPTYQVTRLETFSPRGRLSLLRAVEDGHLEISAGVEAHLYHCLDCRACNTVCPPGVHIGELILRGRVAAEDKHPRPWWMRFVLKNVLTGAARAERLSAPMRLASALRLDKAAVRLSGWIPVFGTRIREMVELAPVFGKPIRGELAEVTPAAGEKRHRVAFFLGCMMNVAMPDVSRATLRVLIRAGCEVVTPKNPKCCGAPHDDQAMLDLSRDMARKNIALFESYLDNVEAVVTDCAGCSGALKEYAEWLREDPDWAERAKKFSAKVRDVTEWLDRIWPEGLKLEHEAVRATYHDPCHLANVQGVRKEPRSLLARIRGLELIPLPDGPPARCCGSAGVYNVTHAPMSLELLNRKMEDIAATGADVVISANPGCLMQLEWGNRRSERKTAVKHVVQLLDESMGDAAPAER